MSYRQRIFHLIKSYFVFILAWIILSSFLDLFFFIIATGCFFIFYYFSWRIKLSSRSNEFFSVAFVKYLINLIYSVFESSKKCVRIIFDEKNIDKSGIRKINVSSLNQEERVLFSNMITMTPGTFVISVNDDDYYIHSIDAKNFDELNTEKIREMILKTRKKLTSDV